MTRFEMVTRSHPTHKAPNRGCPLLGNSGGSFSNFVRETTWQKMGPSRIWGWYLEVAVVTPGVKG